MNNSRPISTILDGHSLFWVWTEEKPYLRTKIYGIWTQILWYSNSWKLLNRYNDLAARRWDFYLKNWNRGKRTLSCYFLIALSWQCVVRKGCSLMQGASTLYTGAMSHVTLDEGHRFMSSSATADHSFSLSSSLDLARSSEFFKPLVYWQGAEGCQNSWNELCFSDQLLRRPDDTKVTLWRQRNFLWIHIRSQYCLCKCNCGADFELHFFIWQSWKNRNITKKIRHLFCAYLDFCLFYQLC